MTDPFTKNYNCVQRLLKEYQKHPKLIVAVDFDDTVYDFHNKGNSHEEVWDVLRRCDKLGFYIVCFTASLPVRFSSIEKHFESKGVKLSSINKNPIPLPFGNHGKIYYNILLDDRAGLGSALETLQTALFLIENTPSSETLSDENPPETTFCSDELRKQGKPYPRTCKACGLGPCKNQL